MPTEALEATENSQKIVIPKVRKERAIITIAGITPLLTANIGVDALPEPGKPKVDSSKKPYEQRFREALYVIDADADRYGFPASGIKQSVVTATGRFGNQHMTEMRGVFSIISTYDDLLEIEGNQPHQVVHWAVPKKGSLMPAVRAQFDDWLIRVPVQFISGLMTLESLVSAFNLAGITQGIGPWRPECDGIYGQFEVRGVQRIEREVHSERDGE